MTDIFDRIEVDDDGCWLWTGAVDRSTGYGRVGVNGRVLGVHRVAYEQVVGPIPRGLRLDHVCHSRDESCRVSPCKHRRCINPAHLEAVTQRVNTLRGRGLSAQRAAQTHCIRGHDFDEKLSTSGKRVCSICQEDRRQTRLARSAG